MVSKRWIAGVCSVLIVVLLLAGGAAVAAELGGKDDPLVSLSYIEQLIPQLNENIEKVISEKVNEFDASLDTKIEEVNKSIDEKISRFEEQYAAGFANQDFIDKVAAALADKGLSGSTGSGGSGEGSGTVTGGGYLYTRVDVATGQTLIGEVGTEILWRLGTGVCVSPGSPGLIDISTGGDLAAGGQLQQNHVYVVTVGDRGFKATSDCRVMIKGPYTIQ